MVVIVEKHLCMSESTEFKLVLFRVKCHREREKYSWLYPLHGMFMLP